MTDLPDPVNKPTHDCDLVKEGPGLTCPAGLPVPRGTVLTRSVLRSAAVLIILTLLVTGLNLWWTARQENAFQASQRQEQQARQRAGEAVEAQAVHDVREAVRAQAASG